MAGGAGALLEDELEAVVDDNTSDDVVGVGTGADEDCWLLVQVVTVSVVPILTVTWFTRDDSGEDNAGADGAASDDVVNGGETTLMFDAGADDDATGAIDAGVDDAAADEEEEAPPAHCPPVLRVTVEQPPWARTGVV